jgi:membrane associated rhomboid family serine protease
MTDTDPGRVAGTEPRPLDIGWDDLNNDAVTTRVEQMRAARQIPLVRPVGTPTDQASTGPWSWAHGSTATLALAGITGALPTWGLIELILRPDADENWYGDSATTGTVLFTVAFALGIGLVIAAWDGVQAHNWAKVGTALVKATPVLGVGGVVGGFLANQVYQSMTENIFQDAYDKALSEGIDLDDAVRIFDRYVQDHIHLPRGIAIAIVGVAVGAALGAASRSGRRALNGAVGGFVGGFIGGFVFDYIGSESDSGTVPRLAATLLTGVLVGAAMGLVETVRRERWLEVVSGGMAGKQFILYHEQTMLGSGADCHVTLIEDPQLAPRQLLLARSPSGLTARSLDPGRPVLVNGRPVTEQLLADSDLLQVGSTVLRYRARAEAAPLPGPIHG